LIEGVLVPSAATDSMSEFISNAAEERPSIPLGSAASGHAMATKKPVLADETRNRSTTSGLRKAEELGLFGLAWVPLLADDRSLGTLALLDTHERLLTEDEVSLLMAFADQASLALEKARLLNEAEARERQATQLYEVTTQLASNHDLDSVLNLITVQVAELMGGRSSAIFRYDDDRGELVVATGHNYRRSAIMGHF
jgi:GAF domain-containing protein